MSRTLDDDGQRAGLVLSRNVDDRIVIHTSDGPITITLVRIRTNSRASIGVDAPDGVLIRRGEETAEEASARRAS